MGAEALPIRGHHLLCMLGFRGFGYSDDFVHNMKQIVARVMKGPEGIIELTTECDAICRACPHQEDGYCVKPEKGNRRPEDADRALLRRIGYAPNTRTTVREAYRRIASNISTGDLGRTLCRKCQWLELGFCVAGLANLKK